MVLDWPVVVGPSGSEVLANYTDFANSGSVTAVIQVDGSQVGGAGDYIAAFVDV